MTTEELAELVAAVAQAREGGYDDQEEARALLYLRAPALISLAQEALEWRAAHASSAAEGAESRESAEAPGGTGPSDEELREIWNDERWANQHMGNRFDLACRALYTRGRSDQAKASEAEIAALRGFVERVRSWSPYHAKQVEELDAELAKGK